MSCMRLILGSLLLCLPLSAQLSAAENDVPETVLSELGLGGLEHLSDAEGEAIRGKFIINPEGDLASRIKSSFSGLPDSLSSALEGLFDSAVAGVNQRARDFVTEVTNGIINVPSDFYLFN